MKLDKELFLSSLPDSLKEYGARHIDLSNSTQDGFELQRWHIAISVLTQLNWVPLPLDPSLTKLRIIEIKVPATNKLGNDIPEQITQDEADRLVAEIVKNLKQYGNSIRTNLLISKLDFEKVQNFFTENHLRALLMFQVNR